MKREISQFCSLLVTSLLLAHCGTNTPASTSGTGGSDVTTSNSNSSSSSSGMGGAASSSSSSGSAGMGGMGGMGGAASSSSSSGSAGMGGMGGMGGMPNVVINEVESSGGMPGDWAELYNAGTATADVSGWVFKDNDDTHSYVIPNGTTLAPGAYFVIEEAAMGYGLGASDSARLYDADGLLLVDSYTWTSHATTTFARCPNGTGAFQVSGGATKGAANDCGMQGSGMAMTWPGGNTVVDVDASNTFGGNLSGLTYQQTMAGAGILWGVRNNPAMLFRLIWSGSVWAPDSNDNWNSGKTLRYPNGNGVPDAEGVCLGEGVSNTIYVGTERDNGDAQVSRLSVLLYDLGAAGSTLTATREWNVTADLPATGANTGIETITWIPDSHLVTKSFHDDRLNKTYDPLDYPGHGAGLFVLGIESTGMLHVYALDHVGGGFSRITSVASGHPFVAAAEFDRETGYLWAHCDDVCGNVVNVLEIDDVVGSATRGRLTVRRSFARPSALMNAAHEGIAIAPENECENGLKSFFWADDAETNGHALRRGTIPCGRFF